MSEARKSMWHRVDGWLSRMRRHRQVGCLLIDASVVAFCWQLTYLFRLGFERWWTARPAYDLLALAVVVALYGFVFQALKVPRNLWRFSGFGEVKRLAVACAVAGGLAAALIRLMGWEGIPRAVLGLHPMLSLMGLCAVRVAYRMLYEHIRWTLSDQLDKRRALVMGAGEAAKLLLAGLHQQGWSVIGLLDDDPVKREARINGTPVRGSLSDACRIARDLAATHVIIALPGATALQRRRAFELASATALPVLTVPSVSELRDGTARVERVRAIEPEDLLGRPPVTLNEASVADLVGGKTVLVTGAGGSIGSELCRQLARHRPARMVLYELSELALYQIEQQLSRQHPDLPLVCLMGDVKRCDHLLKVFDAERPALVFHAAAFKHVPLMEHENAWAALQNNTLGTHHAALAAAQSGAERFVLISTDKAVNPTNVMGASKRLAEILVSHLARTHVGTTQFSAVRFGNVLGSSGSVIPKFKEQIARGGPVTVTDPEITRYFMTVKEAVRLVLQAAALAQTGQVHVLDMGEPVKITELARDLIRLSGHRPEEIPIVFTGLRPGEKLFEELLADADQTLASGHPRLRIAKLQDSQDCAWIDSLLAWLTEEPPARAALRARLKQCLPEYTLL